MFEPTTNETHGPCGCPAPAGLGFLPAPNAPASLGSFNLQTVLLIAAAALLLALLLSRRAPRGR